MKEQYYITNINVKKVRHLQNFEIPVSNDTRKHLLLTGKNGSGKSSILLEIKNYLNSIQDDTFVSRYKNWHESVKFLNDRIKNTIDKLEKDSLEKDKFRIEGFILSRGGGIELIFSEFVNLSGLFQRGEFILAYFGADRKISIITPNGVEKINDVPSYGFTSNPSQEFIKYLVNLKTQQAYARNEGDIDEANKIQSWFDRFESALGELLEDTNLKLLYDYRNYNFKIIQNGREDYGFDELSDGFSAIINIITDLILRMEHNRSAFNGIINYDIQGIVLIDEIETHLHLSLQKKILPFLTSFFTNIQFIITTHSPFILNSIKDATVFDLEKQLLINDMSNYTYDSIVEGYFQVNNYSTELKNKLLYYKELAFRDDLNEVERAKRAELRNELSHISSDFANELRLEFQQIELQRKNDNG